MTVRDDLRPNIFDHDKHYKALISWMRRKRMTAHDLCTLFAEGSTVAHEIWKLYDVEGWPDHAKTYALASLPVGESRWISVKEKLPEDDATVLAAIPFYGNDRKLTEVEVLHCTYWIVGGQKIFTTCEGEEYEAGDVTHWMSLPKPPELGLGESREPLPSVCLNCKHPKSDHYDHSCSGRFGKIECNCHTFIDRCRASRLR